MAKNQVQLLNEQLGKGGNSVVFTTASQTENFYAVHFVTESVVSAITITNCTGESALQTTIPAGTVIFANITAITMTSGVAIGYHN
mgnify:FL=1|tara:strand:- start:524 stop:781 length:258 start_codon:yes stop_codon:yes gene_type:complete